MSHQDSMDACGVGVGVGSPAPVEVCVKEKKRGRPKRGGKSGTVTADVAQSSRGGGGGGGASGGGCGGGGGGGGGNDEESDDEQLCENAFRRIPEKPLIEIEAFCLRHVQPCMLLLLLKKHIQFLYSITEAYAYAHILSSLLLLQKFVIIFGIFYCSLCSLTLSNLCRNSLLTNIHFCSAN